MQNRSEIVNAKFGEYATKGEFCRVFAEDMDSLYLLAFLLTADHQKAEQCFVGGLNDSVESNRVFKEWAGSWARRMVVQNAVRILAPRPIAPVNSVTRFSVDGSDKASLAGKAEIAAVLELPPFDRFVFVMSVLERNSDQDCSLLLGSTRLDVLAARNRALQQIAAGAMLHGVTEADVFPETASPHHNNEAGFELQSYAKSA